MLHQKNSITSCSITIKFYGFLFYNNVSNAQAIIPAIGSWNVSVILSLVNELCANFKL